MNQMSHTTKVCPDCGNDSFTTNRVVKEEILVDGSGDVLDVLRTINSNTDNQLTCTACSKTLQSENELVTEAYFHEVICLK